MTTDDHQAAPEEWSNKRLEIAYQEARAVLETQQSTVNDTDNKALRTTRLTILLIAAVISATTNNLVSLNPAWAIIGGALFVLSLLVGLLTYDDTALFVGPNRAYIARLARDDFTETSWEYDLVTTFGDWINENQSAVDRNSQLLALTQALFFLGIVSITFAVLF